MNQVALRRSQSLDPIRLIQREMDQVLQRFCS